MAHASDIDTVVSDAQLAMSHIFGTKPTMIALATYLGISRVTIHRWISGDTVPVRGITYRRLLILASFMKRYRDLINDITIDLKYCTK